ncbi:hypothetical protein DICPUDRAFT_74149 [Dictyostelium purpureum]|uniref:Uncharacterized protein n=1 Tax=Dictyostelium purpureum TaxID=5786 RepID=F0Z6X5_DICPU|nr:uncharacterized protein DICPUDRAFT_74149 [Dictyostelium purpureum]EGC40230.1 hypothetical protein DICPUDRAFT_74149 [Dictyostelium purpureum]|eukprot:XP_003283166.1 hypothetical protein DICPUDRAFT_74149 [Dictyostelium purpureum]
MITLTPVTGTYFGILGGYYLYLSINVIKQRLKAGVPTGDGTLSIIRDYARSKGEAPLKFDKYEPLVLAIRAHSNFCEYVPIVGVLSIISELHGAPAGLLHAILATFTIGRILHSSGIQKKGSLGSGRKIGAMSTFGVLFLSSASCLYFSNKDIIHRLIGR